MPVPHRLVFVCSGNICRSPMAEVLARGYAEGRASPIEARSAGTLGIYDRPADPNAVAVCAELGLDLAPHRSQGVDDPIVEWADWLVCMEMGHARWLRDNWPEAEDRIVLLGPFGGMTDIEDPLGGGPRAFRIARDEIRRCVEALVDRLPAKAEP